VNCNGQPQRPVQARLPSKCQYHVRGTTFSSQLPDARVAVVNCESKFAEHLAGPAGNHRNCRVPLVYNIKAEFNGDKAKLVWVVSLDGRCSRKHTRCWLFWTKISEASLQERLSVVGGGSTPDQQPIPASDHMRRSPKLIYEAASAAEASRVGGHVQTALSNARSTTPFSTTSRKRASDKVLKFIGR